MPLIQNTDIPIFTDLLISKGVNLFHSCQLKDFKRYLELGGVPSRNLMQQRSLDFSDFDTDSNDQENSVWDKVFFNLMDFGNYFALYPMNNPDTASIPTIYGPISIQVFPDSINESDDVCVSLKSAGLTGFSREEYGIPVERISDIFVCIECENPREEQYIRRTNELRDIFNIEEPGTLNPEVNITIEGELVGFEHAIMITVDPIFHGDVSLYSIVDSLVKEHNLNAFVLNRKFNYRDGDDRKGVLRLICEYLINNPNPTCNGCKAHLAGNAYGEDWIRRIESGRLFYNLDRYLRYLQSGTICEMVE